MDKVSDQLPLPRGRRAPVSEQMRRKGPGLGESWRQMQAQTAGTRPRDRAQHAGRGLCKPGCTLMGSGADSGSLLTSGQLGSQESVGTGPLPSPSSLPAAQEPLCLPLTLVSGHLRGAVHPPWSPEPRALAVFWVLEAVRENRPASSLDLLFLSLAGRGLSRHR